VTAIRYFDDCKYTADKLELINQFIPDHHYPNCLIHPIIDILRMNGIENFVFFFKFKKFQDKIYNLTHISSSEGNRIHSPAAVRHAMCAVEKKQG